MSNSEIIQHPLDPIEPRFDFFRWRLIRRLTIDRLRVLGNTDFPALIPVARAMEIEQVTEADVDVIADVLSAHGSERPTDLHALFLAVSDLTNHLDLDIDSPWTLPIIEPDWGQIPRNQVVFQGTADGVRIFARLLEGYSIVPSYQVIWLDKDGATKEVSDLENNAVGLYLPHGKPIWDWLLARHLTLLCLNGKMSWPDSNHPPIVLQAQS